VRKELIFTLAKLVTNYEDNCKEVAVEMIREEIRLSEIKRMATIKRKKKDGKQQSFFVILRFVIKLLYIVEEGQNHLGEEDMNGPSASTSQLLSGVYGCIWKMVLSLTQDPVPSLAVLAQSIVVQLHRYFSISDKTAINNFF